MCARLSDASVLRVACLQKSLFAVDTPIPAWALVASDVHPHYPISHSRRDLWDPNDKPFAWSNWDGSFG